jgi:hypothetical protein
MQLRQRLALAVLALVTIGTLGGIGGYAAYLRSAAYRNSCANVLSRHLGLPAEIGAVVPRSRTAREFRDVRIYLPERRGEAAFCVSALLTATPTADDPRAYELTLRGGHCEISTRTWLGADYRTVLESGLRPGFDPAGPRRVLFQGLDVRFVHDAFRAELDDASGTVLFEAPDRGRATVVCEHFNGQTTPAPVTLRGEFSPQGNAVRLDRVELTVPQLPLALVRVEELSGLPLRSGSFDGRMVYRELNGHRELSVSGRATDLALAEFTAPLVSPPWRGSAPVVELAELLLVDAQPQRVRFSGHFREAHLGDVLAPWGLAEVGGQLDLRIAEALLTPEGIERLVAAGRCADIDLAEVSEALGWGAMTGRALLIIDDLTLNANRLEALDLRIDVVPNADAPQWIERRLLSELLRRTLGFELPEFLPERFEYARLGVRLQVRDEQLYVFGTHGPREQVILTMPFGGQELPIVLEPEAPFDLRPWLDDLRTRLAEHLRTDLPRFSPREAWRKWSRPASATQPTTLPGAGRAQPR